MAGTYFTTVYLTNSATQNPFTVTSSGLVSVTSGDALEGILSGNGFAVDLGASGTVLGTGGQSGTVYSGTYFSGIVLSNPTTQDPATVGAGGYITNTTTAHNGDAVYGTTAAAWNFTNFGTLKAGGTASAGVYMTAGGTVTNGASGALNALIVGYDVGIKITGSVGAVANFDTVANSGTVADSRVVDFEAVGTVENSGTILGVGSLGVGVILVADNSLVVNGGTSANGALIADYVGVVIFGSSGTLRNFGTVESTATGFSGQAVNLDSGGVVANYGALLGLGADASGINVFAGGTIINGASGATGALIAGGLNGIYLTGGAGTLTNFGTIKTTIADAVELKAGGTISNSGAIEATGTLGIGAQLLAGGSVGNSGLIEAGINGVLTGTTGAAVVVNSGTILTTDTNTGAGVAFHNGGTASNASTGTISAYNNAVFVNGSGGTVSNLGTLASIGTQSIAIDMLAGGSIVNGASASTTALITAPAFGVEISGSAGTVTNFGTVASTATGTGGEAVFLGAGGVIANYGLIIGARPPVLVGVTAHGFAGVVTAATLAATIRNFATITSNGTNDSTGINLLHGGLIVNGETGDTTALIAGSADGIYGGGHLLGTGVDYHYPGAVITVVNYGTIESTGTAAGVVLVSGGTIANSGTIAGTIGNAIVIDGTVAGTVTNFGLIQTASTTHSAVYMQAGGLISNATAATIAGGENAVNFDDTAGTTVSFGTVVNSGTIESTGVTAGDGVNFGQGGVLTNEAGGVIEAAGDPAVSSVGTSAGTVSNFGLIVNPGTTHSAIYMRAGGLITNAAGGTVASGQNAINFNDTAGTTVSFGTVVNSGTIESTGITAGEGINFGQGGVLTNQASGVIEAAGSNSAVFIDYGSGLVTNYGAIRNTSAGAVHVAKGTVINEAGALVAGGSAGSGVIIGTPGSGQTYAGVGTLTNFGTIESGDVTAGEGVYFGQGGILTNQTAGLIQGYAGIAISHASGTVVNSGTVVGAGVLGTSGVGVELLAGGTIVDSGTISGASGSAVSFGGSGGNRLILDPGYHFGGVVIGSTSAGATNTLELGSAASAGTVTASGAFAAEFVNFGTATVDPGALWTFSGSETIGAGLTLANLGILSLAGTLTDLGTLTNTGTIAGGGNLIVDPASLVNSGYIGLTVTFSGGGYLDNEIGGTIAVAGISVYGTLGAATIVNAGTVLGLSGDGFGGPGVYLRAGGSVGNTGLIQGAAVVYSGAVGIGVKITGAAGTVTNSGTIDGTGATTAIGVYLGEGGDIANNAGLIDGAKAGVLINRVAATVSNLGTIIGTAGLGISLAAGGTVVDSGTISGTGGTAISFGGTGGNRLVLDPGYNFGGIVVGSTSAGATNTLELGSTAGAGTVSAVVAAEFVNFGMVTVDAGAQWTLTGTNLLSGVTLSDLGTLTNTGTIEGGQAGVYLEPAGAAPGAGALLTNFGLITGATGVIDSGAVGSSDTIVNYGTIAGTTGAGITLGGGTDRVVNFGTVTGADGTAIVFGSGADTVVIEPGAAPIGTLAGFGVLDTIDLAKVQATEATFSSGTLSVLNGTATVDTLALTGTFTGNNFIVSPDGAGGFDIDTRASIGNILPGTYGYAVVLTGPNASTTVTATGSIAAASGDGVVGAVGVVGSLTNLGRVSAVGSGGDGVYFGLGGFVANIVGSAGGGYISGAGTGIMLGGATGTVVNTGTIVGGTGVVIGDATLATVTNAGTITGTAGTAVSLGGGANRLVVDPGAVFGGVLYGGGGGSVLEIAASDYGSGGSGGAVGAGGATAYVSLGSVVNFSALQVDASATVGAAGVLSIPTLVNQGQVNIGSGDQFAFASVSGSSTGVIDLRTGGTVTFSGVVANQTLYFHPPGGTALIEEANAFGATITDFAAGDTIDLTGFVASGKSFANNALVLTDTLSNHVTLAIVGSFSTSSFVLASDGGTGTDITTVACFCRGTRVLTEAGEVAVEDLAIGDRVVTLSSEARPIKWIGRRAYDGRFAATNHAVLPIRIEAGALGDGVPARDLFVSPEHALYLDDALVPAGLLANGATIRQVERVERVEYFHIELDSHDVILAEGAPAETFVDCDNRLMFQNGAEYAALYPDDDRPAWMFCAPRVEAGSPALAAVRAALLARAEELGHRLELDPDPDLHLIVDGGTIWPTSIAGERYRFHLPAGSATIRLASRSAVPAEIEAGSRDHRRLGVPVERIVLFDRERSIEAAHDDAALSEGFHANEELQRWTNGRARLPESWLRSFPGGATLDVHLVPSGLGYRLPPGQRQHGVEGREHKDRVEIARLHGRICRRHRRIGQDQRAGTESGRAAKSHGTSDIGGMGF